MISIGNIVPDLEFDTYQNEEIKRVKLSDYRGKWIVLMFYPADFTFVCPTELREMATYYDEIKKLGGEVISMSTDTAYAHKAWHDSSPAIKTIIYPMGADPSAIVSKTFNTYVESSGLSLRATFIINPDGVLKAFEMHDDSIGRSAKEILRKLKAAKFVAENNGMVCPASWEPGTETLKPGIDLVGKI
ncbi:redoxin domain-containing protein [Candidatus Micrarchaeota archaeon]|nr:redoxin domain-containing protein [Candidatus Micrarchaeota archaeon]MBU1165434.1 redoxin domain-containing protein [Candidatus Micrarchaeota archaeon]MBU1887218.1 redoxin domain-containing protein [Candidatus Micrarchaeota archaeon]